MKLKILSISRNLKILLQYITLYNSDSKGLLCKNKLKRKKINKLKCVTKRNFVVHLPSNENEAKNELEAWQLYF